MALGEALALAGQGLVSGGARRREAKRSNLATALSLGQRGEDIRRQEGYRTEDLALRERDRQLTVDQLRAAKTEALKVKAKEMLVNNEAYLEAIDSGDHDTAAKLESVAYATLFNRLSNEEKRSELRPYGPSDPLGLGPRGVGRPLAEPERKTGFSPKVVAALGGLARRTAAVAPSAAGLFEAGRLGLRAGRARAGAGAGAGDRFDILKLLADY